MFFLGLYRVLSPMGNIATCLHKVFNSKRMYYIT